MISIKNSCLKFLFMAGSFATSVAVAQTKSVYNQLQVFDPQFFTNNGNALRNADGSPSSKYWQNSADYIIHATLNEKDTSIKGDVTINYTNNSPNTLNYVWLQLDQNLFNSTSRGVATTTVKGDRFDSNGFKGGYNIASVTVIYLAKEYIIKPIITDTRMQLRLPFVLKPNGDKISIKINYAFAIPQHGADRMGRLDTRNGTIYELAQWYPRMCVYDDVMGWNTLPYIGQGEFYCEYGNTDYFITAPADMIVAGSGDLQNPQDVLTATQIKRLAEAAKSDSTVSIINRQEVDSLATTPKKNGTLTWHYNMLNTRDVAWSASQAFMWDAARVNFPSGKKGLAMSVYPVESDSRRRYNRATQYLKHAMEFYSSTYFEYPWHSAFAVAGVALGMEYPGIVFCSYSIINDDLFRDVTHEMGHNWFPMIVGSNERRFAWMDEGFDTFINGYAWTHFNNGEYADTTSAALKIVAGMIKAKDPLMTAPEVMSDGGMYYYKTALGLNMLRNVVLGADRFDYAFNTYIARWAYKHPQPDDFFRTMNDAAGEDLGWFWKEWFYTTWTLDQAITEVKYVKDSVALGSLITVENLKEMAMPITVKINEENGQTKTVQLPVEIWQRGSKWTFKYNSTSKIKSIIIDPENQLPDVDRKNNVYPVLN